MTSTTASPVFVAPRTGDDAALARKADRIIRGAVLAYEASEVYVVRVDNWFGDNWLGFIGKVLGLAGWRDPSRLRVPPFVPSRVKSECCWRRKSGNGMFENVVSPVRLHLDQHSDQNADRLVDRLCPDAALFWVSGDSARTHQASLMAYIPTEGGRAAWYAHLHAPPAWACKRVIHISVPMLDGLEARGASALEAGPPR